MPLSQLVGFVHYPNRTVIDPALRRLPEGTRAAPEAARSGAGVVLGENEHLGEEVQVRLSDRVRMQHLHVVGASGTGKSTLLARMILDDIEDGRGVGVIEPHGDLVDEVLARLPPERLEDVILLDPSDEAFVVGWNVLEAATPSEREMLASDLVGVFQRLSTSWGDQMTSVLNAAILTCLSSPSATTLSDLRRVLIDDAFRRQLLETVEDEYLHSYWDHEFELVKRRNPHGPILTRLDTVLRSRLVREVVTMREGALNFREILDQGRILLCRLSQGAIGTENAALLGSLLVSKIHQVSCPGFMDGWFSHTLSANGHWGQRPESASADEELAPSSCRLGRLPALEGGGADQAERRVPALLVVVDLEVLEGLALGVLAVLEDLDADLGLQGVEEALRHRVVVAVAGAAHAGHHPELLEAALVVTARVLAPAVAVVQQTGAWLPTIHRLLERSEGELRVQVWPERPADHESRVQIQHDGQVAPPGTRTQVGDVGDPDLVDGLCREVLIEDVGSDRIRVLRVRRRLELLRLGADQSALSHQASDPVPTASLAVLAQVGVDPHRAIPAAILLVRSTDLDLEAAIFPAPGALRSRAPGVVATRRDSQHAAHHPQPEPVPVLVDEPVPHRRGSEKIATAFFRMSRSSVTRRRSRRSCASSWSRALPSPGNARSPSFSSCRFHRRSMSGRTPRSRATWLWL